MEKALIVLLVIFTVLTLLPLLKTEHWLVRIWDYPRKQLLVAHTLLLLLYISCYFETLNCLVSGASIFSFIFLIYRIIPYTTLYPKQLFDAENQSNTISILISNVEMQNENHSALLSILLKKKADVVLLLETDKKWQKGIEDIEKHYQYKYHHPQNDTYGILFYSNKEIRNHQYQFLVNEDIPSISCEIKMNDKWVQFYGLHPEPPFPTQSKTTIERDAEILLIAKKIAENRDQPTIVAGDLNDVAWSYTTGLFQKKSRMLDPRIGRGFYSTFHAKYFWARWPLDHIFVSQHFQLNNIERLDTMGSDHFPIFIKVNLNTEKEGKLPEAISKSESTVVEEKINKPNEEN